MRRLVFLLSMLAGLISVYSQSLEINVCKYKEIASSRMMLLSGLQRHSFSSTGDTLALITTDTLFLFNTKTSAEISSVPLPFQLDTDVELGSLVDILNDSIVVMQIYPKENHSIINMILYNNKLKMIDSVEIITDEWIFITGFEGKIRMNRSSLIFDEYNRNQESFVISKKTEFSRYVSHDRNVVYDVIKGFNSDHRKYIEIQKTLTDRDLELKYVIRVSGNFVVFCAEKSNIEIYRVLLVDEISFKILDDIKITKIYGSVRVFDTGFSWFSEGKIFWVKLID